MNWRVTQTLMFVCMECMVITITYVCQNKRNVAKLYVAQ